MFLQRLQGLMLTPLLAAALLAPGAARATFQQASKPVSDSVAVSLLTSEYAADSPQAQATTEYVTQDTLQSTGTLEPWLQAYLDRPRQAKDFQYPAWQRLQWATWGEMQLSGETKRRLTAAILASGILLVLAFKLIAANAAHSVLDKPSDKCVWTSSGRRQLMS
jgi:hypothetical protein